MSTTLTMPALAEPTSVTRPRLNRRTLENGLQVIAIRRPSVPMVEVRLRIPLAIGSATMVDRITLLSETVLKGTESYDDQELEQQLGLLGGQLNVGASRDAVMAGGSVLAQRLPDYLDLLSEVVRTATYPKNDVEDERARLAEHLVIASSSAGAAAAKALAAKLYGDHPYSRAMADPESILGTEASQVRALHRARVRPEGAVLVLVGDLQPSRALDAAEEALSAWSGPAASTRVPRARFDASPQITVVDRPGSVQSAIRFGMPVIGRDDPAYPALQVTSMLFGGYFSSRLVANLREDKGYTYSPRSGIDLGQQASSLTISADVATDVTAAAVNEIRYELGRLVSTYPTDEELENARQYLIGSALIGMSSQAGLASTCANLEVLGLGLDWLAQHQKAIAKVSAQDVRDAAANLIPPTAARIVVVGDADEICADLSTLGTVDRADTAAVTS